MDYRSRNDSIGYVPDNDECTLPCIVTVDLNKTNNDVHSIKPKIANHVIFTIRITGIGC